MSKEKVRFDVSILTVLVVVSVLGGAFASAGVASADDDGLTNSSAVEQVENETETAGNETETETETVTPGDHEYPNEDETVTTSPGGEMTSSGTTEATATGQDTPGFGVLLTLVALIAATLLAVRREN